MEFKTQKFRSTAPVTVHKGKVAVTNDVAVMANLRTTCELRT